MLMMPFFVFFMLLVVEFGLLMWANVSIANASREGARFAAANCATGSCTEALIQARVIDRSGGILKAGDEAQITVSWPNGKALGANVDVAVNHPHGLLFLPQWPGSGSPASVALKSCAKMRLESAESPVTPVGVPC